MDGIKGLTIRPVRQEDNAELASIVKTTLAEFGANKKGTVYFDPTTDSLYELFRAPLSTYFVAELHGEIVGGGGIYPTAGLPEDTCELVKMYLLKKARGKGLGKHLVQKCLDQAKDAGFRKVYIETMPELKQALKTYEKFGFTYIDHPMGNSGHFGCDLWMIKQI